MSQLDIAPPLRIVVEHEGWLLLRDRNDDFYFADRYERDIADCPSTLLLKLEKQKEAGERV
jgi:hypothetical protein